MSQKRRHMRRLKLSILRLQHAAPKNGRSAGACFQTLEQVADAIHLKRRIGKSRPAYSRSTTYLVRSSLLLFQQGCTEIKVPRIHLTVSRRPLASARSKSLTLSMITYLPTVTFRGLRFILSCNRRAQRPAIASAKTGHRPDVTVSPIVSGVKLLTES